LKVNVKFLVQAAVIAALYSALVILASLTPIGYLSFGPVQVRLSEALTILPFFTPAAIPGLFVGCLISNIVGTAAGVSFGLVDIVFGSLATLAAAMASYALRRNKWLVPLPPVVINAIVVGFILNWALKTPFWINALSVGAGQAVACYLLGFPLLLVLEKRRKLFL
jgi:uncharacterized membrane protein